MKKHNTKRSLAESNKLQFDWNLMQSFLSVIDNGSLQAAARSLGHSQPTMGRHIELLESQLGVALFERTGRALMPTEQARAIASVARVMRTGADQVCHQVQSENKELAGTVRISASHVIATQALPDAVVRIQQQYPEINIAVVATDKVSNLLRRDADIAIRMVNPKQPSLIAKRIGEIGILPCASQSYIDRWGMPRSIADIFNHRVVGPDQNKEILHGFAMIAKSLEMEPSKINRIYRTDDFLAQLAAVKAGIGIGFVSKPVIQQHPDLVALPFTMPIPPLSMWLAVHREIRTTPRIRAVFDELAVQLKQRLKD